MAHTFRDRSVRNVPSGSVAQVSLTAGSNGVFIAEAWDLASPTVHRAVPIPGTTVPVGPVNPPSVVYVEGVFSVVMNPAANQLAVSFRAPNGSIIPANPVPLSGAIGDSIMVVVDVHP